MNRISNSKVKKAETSKFSQIRIEIIMRNSATPNLNCRRRIEW